MAQAAHRTASGLLESLGEVDDLSLVGSTRTWGRRGHGLLVVLVGLPQVSCGGQTSIGATGSCRIFHAADPEPLAPITQPTTQRAQTAGLRLVRRWTVGEVWR